MPAKTEARLYKIFVKEMQEEAEGDDPLRGRGRPLCPDGKFVHLERRLGDRTLYLLGEQHGSRGPVDYTHEQLVPKIKQDPRSWLVLYEGAQDVVQDFPNIDPDAFYFHELAKLFGILYDDAIADIYTQDTRAYIKHKTGITEVDFDRLLLKWALPLLQSVPKDKREGWVGSWILNMLGKHDTKYRRELLLMGPIKDLHFDEIILPHWNDYSKIRFHQLLKQYADKSNLLVSVGLAHIPVFE